MCQKINQNIFQNKQCNLLQYLFIKSGFRKQRKCCSKEEKRPKYKRIVWQFGKYVYYYLFVFVFAEMR